MEKKQVYLKKKKDEDLVFLTFLFKIERMGKTFQCQSLQILCGVRESKVKMSKQTSKQTKYRKKTRKILEVKIQNFKKFDE